LVLDGFHGHVKRRVKAKVNEDSDIVISEVITKLLQSLDVDVNQ
jgi:hypothetical protein